MNLYTIGHDYKYEMENLCRLFFPGEKVQTFTELSEQNDNDSIRVETIINNNRISVSVTAFGRTFSDFSQCESEEKKEIERQMAVLLFKCLVKLTGFTPKWGVLTGVRPIKLFRRLADEKNTEYAQHYLREKLLVSEEKIAIATETSEHEGRIIARSYPKGFSLYISIPFCPTRCSYCSFVSQSVERAGKLLPDYVSLLVKEIAYTGKIAKSLGLDLQTVYIGGGTPTILSAEQLSLIIEEVYNSFDTSKLMEFTVEAGRPDTVTSEKLYALKNHGVERVSINPQTFNDDVLNAIGRKHTSAQTAEAMLLAKSVGFANINMDIIAGLPTDTLESFNNTLDRCFELEPHSITVHTLSIKRASFLVYTGQAEYNSEGAEVSLMVDSAAQKLFSHGYKPYYLYRQSRTLGNLENTGWSLVGSEGLYNVYIMDETHTILACGAGAVTKLRQPAGDYIERIFNYKFPYEYISGFKEMLKRKERILEFYEKFN